MNKDLLKENRVHGNVLYPLSIYSMIDTQDPVLDCHWHEESEFLLVKDGKAVFQIDIDYYDVKAGEAIFVNSGELHAGYRLGDSTCSFDAIVFSMDLLCSNSFDTLQEKFINPVLQKKYCFPKILKGNEEWEKEVLKLLGEIVLLNRQKPYTFELLTKAKLYTVFSCVFRHHKPESFKGQQPLNSFRIERLKKVINYINTFYFNKLTLAELASLANMSRSHFCRFFKQMLKKSPVDYINYVRVQNAARLLRDSDKKITEIALDVGFDSTSYLILRFKKYMGCTPSNYRKIAL